MVHNNKKFSPKRKWLHTQALLFFLTILGPFVTPILGEWVSILDQANVFSVANLSSNSSAKENLISKTFKSTIYTEPSPGAYGDNSNWYTIDLGTP